MGHIIERKTVHDLACSIKDTRYLELLSWLEAASKSLSSNTSMRSPSSSTYQKLGPLAPQEASTWLLRSARVGLEREKRLAEADLEHLILKEVSDILQLYF